MRKIVGISCCIIALVALAIWAPNVAAFQGFDDGGGAGLPACAACHPDIANFGPDHAAHAALANNDCNSCHMNSPDGTRNNPPLANCVRCHGRDQDGNPSADFSAGIGRGLRQHHVTLGVAECGNCHQDTDHDTTGSAPENVVPSFYPEALGGAGLDPCDGSEEQFDSMSVSLDNDGDGLTDGDDPDCAPPPECTTDADCDDGTFCNGAEVCDAGTCVEGAPPSCDDGVACTDDSCDSTLDDCLNTPNDANCGDNNVCNGIETCDPQNDCQAGTSLNCDDGDLCTNDSCDPVAGCANEPVVCPEGEQCDPGTGECLPIPECTTDADCDDTFFCNGAEVCDVATGTCQPGTAPDCDDGVACTLDTCDEVNDTCANTPDDAACDNGDVCDGAETCDPQNGCQPGTPLNCDDGDLCTTDSCDPVAGCANEPVVCPEGEQCDPGTGECVTPPGCVTDAECDDGLFCNGAEVCDANGECQPGTAPDCDDGVACTVDTCDEANDTCANTPDDAACDDDGLFCTGQEVCDPELGCVSTGDPCPAGMTCNEETDTCDQVAGKVTICHIPPGNPAKVKTLSIDAESVPDHLAHGDTLGPCPE